jgi:hypothetical protein
MSVFKRYLRQGDEVPAELLRDVQSVCEEVLWTLLRRLNRAREENSDLETWLKHLDYIQSALLAEKTDLNSDMDAWGIDHRLPGAIST